MSALAKAGARFALLCEEARRDDALAALRRAGREAFTAAGLPDTAREEWRYTSLAPLAALDFVRAPSASLRVVAAGAEVRALREAPGALGDLVDLKLHPLAALATALLDDGVAIRVPAGVSVAEPVALSFAAAGSERPSLSTPRVRIEAGAGTRIAFVQQHTSQRARGAHLTNAVSEIVVGEDAHVELTLVQRENDDALHFSNTVVRLERGARFTSHVVTLGGRLVRNDLAVVLAGEGAECNLNALYVGTGERLVDNHSLVDHAVPRGTSRQLYKGVLGDTARGVFRGRVVVRPGAQQTNAAQSNPNLLLSDGAESDSKPQLEIHADDVKCSHGAAIGRLDENALFYVRSRGVAEREARALLTLGFAAQVLEALPDAALREELRGALARTLGAEAQP